MSTTAIAEYSATAAALAELKTRLTGATYEVTTTAGMDAAKKDRRELVTLRTSLDAKRKEIKAPALERCRLIDDEAKRITAELLTLEYPIDQQIKAEEARKEAEKAEKARQAAAAQKILDDKIIEIGKLPLRCIGKTAEEIALFLATLEAKEIGGEYTGETRQRAETAKAEAVAEIRAMHTAAVEAKERAAVLKAEQEAEAARLEAERVENERLAAIEREELARREAELAEQQKLNELEAERLKKLAEEENARTEAARKAEQEAADKLRAEQEAHAAEVRRQQEAQAEREREEARQAAIVAEQKRLDAERERKAAERARKLAEVRCKDAATAFKKILAICQNESLNDAAKVAEIALVAEGNL